MVHRAARLLALLLVARTQARCVFVVFGGSVCLLSYEETVLQHFYFYFNLILKFRGYIDAHQNSSF
jgi:hypothetical protein